MSELQLLVHPALDLLQIALNCFTAALWMVLQFSGILLNTTISTHCQQKKLSVVVIIMKLLNLTPGQLAPTM